MNIRQTEPSPKSRPHLPLHVYLSYLLIGTFLLTGVSFARYISFADGSDSARVAAGTVVVTYDGDAAIEMIRPTDDGILMENFNFYVSNSGSEVAIQYDLVVELDAPLPDGVTMTLDGEPCEGNSDNIYTFTNMGTFAAGVETINPHTLTFTGDFSEYQTPGVFTYPITISVLATQID